MPTYKGNGQIYHLIGSLLSLPQIKAQILKIYFSSDVPFTEVFNDQLAFIEMCFEDEGKK